MSVLISNDAELPTLVYPAGQWGPPGAAQFLPAGLDAAAAPGGAA